jgi:DNA (cytosine-5)-methyltransferase 1
MPNKKKIRVVDLFSGCGGMSLGFQEAGFDVVAAYDNWDPAIEVYKRNFDHPIIKKDLFDADSASDIAKHKPEIIIGGPPCQDFSSAGFRNEDYGRAVLSLVYSKIVAAIGTDYFVMENVPEIFKSKTYQLVEANFRENGYKLTKIVLDASFFGVPQKRKRAFTIGSKLDEDDFLKDALLSGKAKKPMTVFDYLGHGLGVDYYFRVPRSYQRRGVFSIYEPSPTIRGVDRPIPRGYKTRPNDPAPIEQVRVLTPKERSLIQTFPETFEFFGSKSDQNQMIGNAVPVNLAKYVAATLLEYLCSKRR